MSPIQYSQNASPIKDDNNDEIRIVVATEEHREGLLRLMRYSFLPREPIEATLGTTWEEARASLEHEIDDVLSQPYSFVAVHPTEGVVGCRTCRYIRIDGDKPDDANDFVVVEGDAPSLRIFQIISIQLMHGWATEFSKRGFQTALQFISLCVDERFSNRGLAKRMIDETMRLAERLRVDCAFALATNVVSQRVLQKAGFVTWRSLNYLDIVNEETGIPWVVPNDGTKSIKWVVKVLGRQAMSG